MVKFAGREKPGSGAATPDGVPAFVLAFGKRPEPYSYGTGVYVADGEGVGAVGPGGILRSSRSIKWLSAAS